MSEVETFAQAEARRRREAIEAAPDLSPAQARALADIMDRDATGMPEVQVKDLNAVNWLAHGGLVLRAGSHFVATEAGARAYVRHVKAGKKL